MTQPLQNCIGPTIPISQEIHCLPYAGFKKKCKCRHVGKQEKHATERCWPTSFCFIIHATSPKLYWSYYPHLSTYSLSPVCGIFFYVNVGMRANKKNITQRDAGQPLFISINHATSPKLYRSYYPHQLRDSLSPVCGIFFNVNLGMRAKKKNIPQRDVGQPLNFFMQPLQNCIGSTIPISREILCLPYPGFF